MKFRNKSLWGALILCAFILTTILSPAMATVQSSAIHSVPDSFCPGVPSWIVKAPEYFTPITVDPTIKFKPDFSLGVTEFNQNNYSDLMPTCNKPISQIGCALTSTAMVFTYFGVKTDPPTLNTCAANWMATNCKWEFDTAAAHCSSGLVKGPTVYNTSSSGDPTTFYYTLRKCLYVDHNPPILTIWRHNDPNTLHFVVVVAYANSGTQADDFTINDPLGNVWSLGNYLDYGDTGHTIDEYHQ